MMKTALRVFMVFLASASITSASAPKAVSIIDQELPEEVAVREGLFAVPVPTHEQRMAALQMSEKGRSVASAGITKEDMSPELRKMLDELFVAARGDGGMDGPERLEALFVKWNSEYDLPNTPTDKKFYIATLAPIHAFRGIVIRSKKFFSQSDFIHSALLTQVKAYATKTNIYLPGAQGELYYDYITSPYLKSDGSLSDSDNFKDEVSIAQWSVTQLLPLVAQSASRLEQLNLSKPVVWDHQVIFGQNTFPDGIGRFKWVGEFEKNMSLAGLYNAIASLTASRAYSMEGALKLAKTVGREYGLDGWGPLKDVEGGSAKRVMGVVLKSGQLDKDGLPVAKPEYRDFMRSRGTRGADISAKWMSRARMANLMGFNAFKAAWNSTDKSRRDEDLYLINTAFFNTNRQKASANLNMVERILNSTGPETVRSDITGEKVTFNYGKFFTNPPIDLKFFLPVAFDENPQRERKTSVEFKDPKTGKMVKKSVTFVQRNYAYGSPKRYVISEYRKYFPNVNNTADVEAALRVMGSVKGNWLSVPGMPRQ